jgi:hypothetical protein
MASVKGGPDGPVKPACDPKSGVSIYLLSRLIIETKLINISLECLYAHNTIQNHNIVI